MVGDNRASPVVKASICHHSNIVLLYFKLGKPSKTISVSVETRARKMVALSSPYIVAFFTLVRRKITLLHLSVLTTFNGNKELGIP